MKRNIVIGVTESNPNTSDFAEYIHISQLSNIVNCSVDYLSCDCLEYLPEEAVSQVIQQLMQKIRPLGYISITISDVKSLCKDYLSNKLAAKKFVSYINQKQSILNKDNIISVIDYQKFTISKLDSSDYIHNILIQRNTI